MYEYADAVVAYLNGQFIEIFGSLKFQLSMDELNVLKAVKLVYQKADDLVRKILYRVAVVAYEDAGGEDISMITEQWLFEVVLESYNPVTRYSYVNEIERKLSRLFEAIMSDRDGVVAEVQKALKYWSDMVAQYAIITVDSATEQAYVDSGVEEVIWCSHDDNRRCKVCRSREGVIYSIDNIPSKPHLHCRCFVIPVGGG